MQGQLGHVMMKKNYNPDIKRFINQDILTGSLDNSQSLNRYSYVQGNPVSYTDPFGLSPVNGLFSNTNDIHTTLTVLGFTPGPGGVVADLLDAGIYLVEGDLSGTALAFLAVFCGSAALTGKAAKAGKAMNKANKLSNTSQLVNRASDMMSAGNSFMRAAMNGSDATQVVKAAKQGRVIDKLKSAVTSAANKLNPKTISKVELDDHIRLVSQGTPSGSMRYNLQFFGGGSTKGKGIKTSFGKTSGKAYQSGSTSEVFYRTMSQADYEYLTETRILRATGETCISPTKSFSSNYDGVMVRFELESGTTSMLEKIGLSNGDRAKLAREIYPDMPYVSGIKWTQDYAFFKAEGKQINIGLDKGKALEYLIRT